MSEEEKKAIEWLKYLQETREEQIRQQAWVGTNTFDAIDAILNLIEKQRKEIETEYEEEKYRFTIIYKNRYKNHDINRENQHTVSLFAGTLEQALTKLNKITPNDKYSYKEILDWSAVEILEEEPSELNDWIKQYNEYYLRSLKEFKEKGE